MWHDGHQLSSFFSFIQCIDIFEPWFHYNQTSFIQTRVYVEYWHAAI